MASKNQIFYSTIAILVAFFLFQPYFGFDFNFLRESKFIQIPSVFASSCQNECTYGEKQCLDSSHYRICGNYDSDPCSEWSGPISCLSGQICQNGQCVASCQNECTFGSTERRCSSNYLQQRTCGNYDSDPCSEWSDWSNVQDCGNSGWTNDYKCSGNWVQRKWIERGCSNSQCYANEEWRNWENCSSQGKICQNGQCVAPPNNPPRANAGPDKEVLETQTVILEGSGSDPDGDPITYRWTCSGGTLSNPNIAQPTFTAPSVSSDTYYTCNLTVTDSRGASASDSMVVLVKNQTLSVALEAIPSSGSAPLNGVDLKATVSGTAIGTINYKFDCQSDGIWDYTFYGTNENPKIVVDACNYPTGGTYNAKVYVERGAADPAWAQATIIVSSPYPVVDLKANGSDGPITIAYNTSATLSWTSNNANSCYASGDWSGTKPLSGSESTGNLTSSKTYTITCSGPGGSASDSVTVNVASPSLYVSLSASPSSGCSPLNNVDLIANVYGTVTGNITYYFDCTNDGIWERIDTSANNSYTAYDLCNYPSPGTYTPRVRVERGGYSAENTTQIYVSSCYAPSVWVDIKANGSDGPITIPYNSSATLTWNSSNANYCYASGAWSGTKPIFGSESTGNLTLSPRTYTITCTGPGGSASDSVTIYLQQVLGAVSPTIQKKVRNLSDGQTQFFDSIYADPSEVLEFQLTIYAGSGIQNLRVRDFLPEKISLRPNSLKIDGILTSGDIISGIFLGNLSAGQTKTITFLADVAPANQFSFGQTNLVNTATIYWNGNSFSDSATIIVKKAAVAGAATAAPTGFKVFSDYLFIPLIFSLVLIWLFKSHIIKWEEWLDERKKEYQKFRAEKLLRLKIAKIRAEKFLREI